MCTFILFDLLKKIMLCLLPSVVGLENPITGDASQDYPLLMNVSVPLSYFIAHLYS